MKILAIDPGSRYSGYALFSEPKLSSDPIEVMLVRYGLIRSETKNVWLTRCRNLISIIGNELFFRIKPNMVAIEFPEFQGGIRGYSAARAGDTLILAALCGGICTMWDLYAAHAFSQKIEVFPPNMIRPSQWKGQLPKNIVRDRINKDFHLQLREGIEENISDAIGLGQYFLTSSRLHINYQLPSKRQDL